MLDDQEIIKKAQSAIGDMDQQEIRVKDEIDVRVLINQDGRMKFYTVRFYNEQLDGKVCWISPEIVER